MKRLITICLIAAVILTATDQAQAATLKVPSAKYPTIQTAIDAAVNGDEVVVADDIYTGTGNRDIEFFGKAITVRSKYGPENCIIDCEGSTEEPHRGFYFHSGETSSAVLDGFTIRNGQTDNGGGIGCYLNSSPTITNCIISENKAGYWGGGIDCRDSSPTITNCTISGNAASVAPSSATGGGGINCIDSNPTIIDCTINSNTSTTGGGIGNMRSSPTIINCTISSNTSTHSAGGIGCYWNSSPTITNCIITDNTAEQAAGGIYCYRDSFAIITNNIITGNSAGQGHGGGIMCWDNSSPSITNNIFMGNSARFGGGINCNLNCSPSITNNIIVGNSANDQGGGIYCGDSSPDIINNTIIRNWARWGGGIYSGGDDSFPTVLNTILWMDSPQEIYLHVGGSVAVTYSNVQGSWTGEGNIDADPLFADADGRLAPGSPCIDAGDDSAVLVTTDLDGNPRIVGIAVDMGAFEAQLPDPVQLLKELAQQVIDLDLPSGIETSLLAKLDAAQKANDSVAINLLQSFINAVEAQRGNKITEDDAVALIAAAQQIIDIIKSW